LPFQLSFLNCMKLYTVHLKIIIYKYTLDTAGHDILV
jgi:hypothetical protein